MSANLTVEAKALADLKTEKTAVEGERRVVEADLGPVRYLAMLLGQPGDSVMRWFILVVALLLDPAAVLLLLASTAPKPVKAKSFFGTAEVPTATAKMRLVQFAEEIVSVLASDPNASIRLTVEISADFPDGASDTVKRAVSENARNLGLKTADWE